MDSASSSPETSSPVQTGSTSAPAPPSPGRSRQTRIHFPAETDPQFSRTPGQLIHAGAGLRSLESSLAHPQALLVPGSSPDNEQLPERRRVRSANASDSIRPSASYSRDQFLPGPTRSKASSRRTASYTIRNADRSHGRRTSIGSSPLSAGVLLPSEEDADQNDDPNILADLRKALQYKPHVEQHLKEAKSLTEFTSSSFPSTSQTTPATMSPKPFPTDPSSSHSEPNTPMKTEFIDFSPSAGKSALHPIPKSADDGATLDWSGSTSDEEGRDRRWTMSLSRRSSKEKHPTLSRKAVVEKQDIIYTDKLTRIRSKASILTMRKAEITKDQLQRRYTALNASYAPNSSHLNLADVARWFAKQENVVKSLIVENEPMPWLRHLLQKRGQEQKQQRNLSPWNLSAMIVDEYTRSSSDAEFILTSSACMHDDLSDAGSSASAAVARARRPISRPNSFHSDKSVVRRKSDDLISFEPMVHSRRSSGGTDSRVSVDTQLKRWRQSLVGRVDPESSSQSSMVSRKRNDSVEQPSMQTGRSSPISSRSPLHNLGIKKRTQSTPLDSDDGRSSAGDSMVERGKESREPDEKQLKKVSREGKRSRFHLSLDLKSQQGSLDESRYPSAALSISDLRTDALKPYKSQSLPTAKKAGATVSTDGFDLFSSPNRELAPPIVLNYVRKPNQKKMQRLSLPPAFQTPKPRKRKPDKRNETENRALTIEYSRKKEALDALMARNARMKNLLQVASKSITEYDETQRIMSEKLGLKYSCLPFDVLEAFKHDPSVTTGHLRTLKGWRAVEDIQTRRERQKEILQAFVESLPDSASPLSLPENGIYEAATTRLTCLVERLYNQRSTVLSYVRQTQELLSKVKKIRNELKPEFDEASQYTSLNYPELVRLESLLDEFVNEGNALWKLGEAFLSFLLTSAAPLMKTFGRPIWDELHDFLVIPLYRNGFSGEDHWYPVTFPHRSLPHWFRLLLSGAATPLLLQQGIRTFIALLTQGYVLRVPSFIPAFAVYLIFTGIMCAFAFLLSVMVIAVLCELFIVIWWTAWLLYIVR